MFAKLRTQSVLGLIVAGVCLHSVSSFAGTISFSNNSIDLNGTGFGNVLTILAVQSNNSEFGSVLRSGGVDVLTDDAKNVSQTRSVAELLAEGITSVSKMRLILNIAEPGSGPDLNVFDFTMRFTDNTGNAIAGIGDATYTAPVGGLNLTQVAAGVGGAGWIFNINLTAAEEAALFASNTNRIGMLISRVNAFTLTGGAPDSFFVARVPEPSSCVLFGLGCLALGWKRRLRRSP